MSRLRAELFDGDRSAGSPAVADAGAAARRCGWTRAASRRPRGAQLVDYLAAARAALGALPTQETIVLERFFDESGGMQLVIHAPFGSRINRAWGLALRKRFCVKFNFELQAAATEDAIVLSLSTSHSFPLADVARYLHSQTVRPVLVQAMLAAPMFAARWRWIAGDGARAAALPRRPQGAGAAAADARGRSDGGGVSRPDRLRGEHRRRPRNPGPSAGAAGRSTIACTRRWTSKGSSACCAGSRAATIDVVARDLPAPSPLAMEILNARPYAYLDDAPLEERRTQAVMGRRWLDDRASAELGRLDAQAIERVRREAWPEPASADELHDALLGTRFRHATSEAARQQTGAALLERSPQTAVRLASHSRRAPAGG